MSSGDNTRRYESNTPVCTTVATIDEVIGRLASVREVTQLNELHIDDLERRLGRTQAAERDLAEQLIAAEERSARLMSLYVATYQLHASLDPADVRATIAEIASNLLGAERFALLLRGQKGSHYQVALEQGLQDDDTGLFVKGSYVGRHPSIDATFTDGVLRISDEPNAAVLAVVPLVVQDAIVGALVILKLLRHRGSLAAHDRDLLDLLGAHAASALFVAQMHTTADRKLKTLDSLVRLAQRT